MDFETRLDALKRLYARKLGVASLLGGEDSMWKLRRHCPEPAVEPVLELVSTSGGCLASAAHGP